MFDFVDAHPFSDGNGRMCRLIANYVLSLITPFPVALYSGTEGRENYLAPVVNVETTKPWVQVRTLAAMLIKSALRGWKSLFHDLGERNLLSPEKDIWPLSLAKLMNP